MLFEGRSRRASRHSTSFSKRPRSTGPSSGIVSGRSSISCPAIFGDRIATCFRHPKYSGSSASAIETLREFFGETVVQQELRARLTPEDFYGVLRRGQGGVFPSLALLKHEESPVRAQVERAERVLRRYGETPIKTVPRTFARDVRNNLRRSGQEPAATTLTVGTVTARARPSQRAIGYGDRVGYGPGSLISVDPPIFLSGLAFKEYVGIAGAFGRRFGNRPAAFVLYPTWTIASKEQAALVIAAAQQASGQISRPPSGLHL